MRIPTLILVTVLLVAAEAVAAPVPSADVAAKRDHWSFKPVVRPEVPPAKDARWSRNPVDAFVAAEHERRGLTPRPPAAKAVLFRRVYLDLIGLPPTRAELHAFLADESPDAYEKVVDRLLASPQHGERWGRHWLDVWRYSDWAGYAAEVRESQPHVWRWRDWVVESLNADKPYSEILRYMVAADEISPHDPQALRATGFLARNWYKFNRNVWLDNTVEHTGKAFLGVTLNCARCHDHMYDPVTQKEHYRFRAFFEPYDVRTDRVPGEPDPRKGGLVRAYDKDPAKKTFLFLRGDEKQAIETEPLAPGVPAALSGGTGDLNVEPVSLPAPAYYQGLQPWVRDEVVAITKNAITTAETEVRTADEAVAKARHALDATLASPSQPRAEAGASEAPAPHDQPATGTVLFDDFSAPRPDLWTSGPGKWAFADGKLTQSEAGETFRTLTSLAGHPADFTARCRFTITGGNKWCSVGISFDTHGSSEAASVYLSAHAGGPAVALQWTENGQHVYPPGGSTPLPVKLNEPYDLRVDVRGQLLNVYVDDVRVKAFTLPRPRKPGKFAVWTFDATAAFDRARVDALPADVKLAEKIDGTPTLKPEPSSGADAFAAARAALEKAQRAAVLARLNLAAARAENAATAAKLAADDAKYATPARAEAPALAAAAGKAEREANVWRLEATAAAAEDAKSEEQKKKLVESKKKLEEAKAKLREPATDYTPLTPVHPPTSTGRRLALANWIVHPSNPLTARVAVNHIWARHFGEGIVATVFDFGVNGKPPTHPALLDWLAAELVSPSTSSGQAGAWSMKRIHRLIVTSETYKMDSSDGPAAAANRAADPDNHYLWRSPVRRMEAELVRDGLLHLAGKLDPKLGGPDHDHAAGQTTFRRSLYYRHAHEKQMTFLRIFDAASPNECYRRQHSVIPQQALALANSPLAIAQARTIAANLKAEADFVTAAFEQILSRPPTDAERAACDTFLKDQSSKLADPAKLTAFAAGEAPAVPPAADPAQRARENLVHVLLNHNDFVTIR